MRQKSHKGLEVVIKNKVMPVVEDAMQKYLGVSISELNKDITEKLERNPLWDFSITPGMPFKKAKKLFKRMYLKKLLQTHYGNVSLTAKIANIDRRSVHRLVKSRDAEKIRKNLPRPYDIKQQTVSSIIGDVLDSYKGIIHPKKLEEIYMNVSNLSKDILDELPDRPMTLHEAEEVFEKDFILSSLKQNSGNIRKTAGSIGIRYETLLRKMKRLGI